jgi:hypothetical protein
MTEESKPKVLRWLAVIFMMVGIVPLIEKEPAASLFCLTLAGFAYLASQIVELRGKVAQLEQQADTFPRQDAEPIASPDRGGPSV